MKHRRLSAGSFAALLDPLAALRLRVVLSSLVVLVASLVGARPAGAADVPFTERVISTDALGAFSVFAADVDGDGDIDILSASATDDKIAWYENDGGSPPTFTERLVSTAARTPASVFATDVNGDGDTDVLSASIVDDKIALYENKLTCGDRIIDPGEECDAGGESATCDADCTVAECGDGTTNLTAGEECDGGLDCTACVCDAGFEPTTPASLHCGPPRDARCLAGGACEMHDPDRCFDLTGLSRGAGTTCGDDAGPDGVDSMCADLPTISLVPVATGRFGELDPAATIVGNEIILRTGGIHAYTVFIEIRVGNWDPDDIGVRLRAYQINLDSSGYSSGLAGTLTPKSVACDDDDDCLEVFGGVCEVTGGLCAADIVGGGCLPIQIDRCGGPACGSPFRPVHCQAGFILTGRDDYVFRQAGGDVSAVDLSLLNFRFSAATSSSEGIDDPDDFPIGGLYAGTFVLDVGPDVRGTFTITIGDSAPGTGLFRATVLHEPIPLLDLVSAQITVVLAGACCDESTGTCTFQTEQECTSQGFRYGGDGSDCSSVTPACEEPPPVPTVSGWGMAALLLALLAFWKVKFGRTRRTRTG